MELLYSILVNTSQHPDAWWVEVDPIAYSNLLDPQKLFMFVKIIFMTCTVTWVDPLRVNESTHLVGSNPDKWGGSSSPYKGLMGIDLNRKVFSKHRQPNSFFGNND